MYSSDLARDVRPCSPARRTRSGKRLGAAVFAFSKSGASADSFLRRDTRRETRPLSPSVWLGDGGARLSLHPSSPASSTSQHALRARTLSPMGSRISSPLPAHPSRVAGSSSLSSSEFAGVSEISRSRRLAQDSLRKIVDARDGSPQARLRKIVEARSASAEGSRGRARSLDALAGGRVAPGSWSTRPAQCPQAPLYGPLANEPIDDARMSSATTAPRRLSGSPSTRSTLTLASKGKTTSAIFPTVTGLRRCRGATPPPFGRLRPRGEVNAFDRDRRAV